jgi:hypothetical protein
MDNSENILIVASGFGIVAHLPYLKQLIHGYNAREVRAHRIHLVWQVQDIGKSWPLLSPFAHNLLLEVNRSDDERKWLNLKRRISYLFKEAVAKRPQETEFEV